MNSPTIEPTQTPGIVHVSQACKFGCGRVTHGVVHVQDIDDWKAGAHAQVAFSDLSPGQRDALFITGVCEPCTDAMFDDF